MTQGMNLCDSQLDRDERLITSILIKQIGAHNSWMDKVDAAMALATVQRVASDMRKEQLHLQGQAIKGTIP